MNRALSILRVFVAVACLSPLVSLTAGDRYRITLVLYPGDDAVVIAKRLAAAYQGQLETPVDDAGSFEITMSSATADLLARDPRVAEVRSPAVTSAAEVTPNAATSWTIGDYGYDAAGNIKKIGTAVYVYDSESRLKSEQVGMQTQQALTYDGFGNILSITEGSKSFTVGADDSSNRADDPSTAPDYLYGMYDGAGNMVTSVTTTQTVPPRIYTFTYDALNVMTKSTTDASRAYVYNANDERIGTITLTGPNGTEVSSQWTIRDPGGQVLRRFRKQGSEWRWMQDYIYRDGKMLASESNDQFKTLHYHLDHLGTPRLITGNGGVEVARHTYYPFGEEAPGTTPQVAEPKKFTGHERDSGGLDYMHARFYDYSMGRFLSVDPSRDFKRAVLRPQRWNRYAYALNNPLLLVDPDGREEKLYVLSAMGFWDSSPSDADIGKAARNSGTTPEVVRRANKEEILETIGRVDQSGTDILVIAAHTFDNGKLGNHDEISTWGLLGWGSLRPGEIVDALGDAKPAVIVLYGCSTAGMAQDIAAATGIPTLGTTGDFNEFYGFSDFVDVIDDATKGQTGDLIDGTTYRVYDDPEQREQ